MLLQEQIDYITATTNERGAVWSQPYTFLSTELTGAKNDYLNIIAVITSSGKHQGGNVKAHHDVLDGTVSDAFKALVGSVLDDIERANR